MQVLRVAVLEASGMHSSSMRSCFTYLSPPHTQSHAISTQRVTSEEICLGVLAGYDVLWTGSFRPADVYFLVSVSDVSHGLCVTSFLHPLNPPVQVLT